MVLPEFENKSIVFLMIAFVGILFAIYLFRKFGNKEFSEGFTQMEKFILKQDAGSYDDFYAHIYDEIHLPSKRCDDELMHILQSTSVDENSVFLDVGCGTGETLKILGEAEGSPQSCCGIDKSSAMVSAAQDKCGTRAKIKHGDVTDPMHYDRKTFTHILCLYFTIYEIEDKPRFFENCRYWLKNGGVLVVHIVDKARFNTVVPAGVPEFIDNPQKYVPDRILKSTVDFGDFKYESKYDFSNSNVGNGVVLTETFTDTATRHIRQNERKMMMDDADTIVKMAQNAGFTPHGKIEYGADPHQHLYLFI